MPDNGETLLASVRPSRFSGVTTRVGHTSHARQGMPVVEMDQSHVETRDFGPVDGYARRNFSYNLSISY